MDKILVINAGSATIKFKIFSSDKKELTEEEVGIVERIRLKDSFIKIKTGRKQNCYNYPSGILNHQQELQESS